jgi:hypothetical protein
MLSLFALFLGFTGMLGFWSLAWWLLKQPVTTAALEPSPRQSVWRNEPTQGRGLPPVPPSQAFEEPADAPVPSRRTHESSSSNTQFFSRTDLNRRENLGEGTEILHDGLPSSERTAFITNPFPEAPPAPSHASVPPARSVPPAPPARSVPPAPPGRSVPPAPPARAVPPAPPARAVPPAPPARAVPPAPSVPSIQAKSRKTWLFGGSGTPDGS